MISKNLPISFLGSPGSVIFFAKRKIDEHYFWPIVEKLRIFEDRMSPWRYPYRCISANPFVALCLSSLFRLHVWMGEPANSVTKAKGPPAVYPAPLSRGMTLPCNSDNARYVPVSVSISSQTLLYRTALYIADTGHLRTLKFLYQQSSPALPDASTTTDRTQSMRSYSLNYTQITLAIPDNC